MKSNIKNPFQIQKWTVIIISTVFAVLIIEIYLRNFPPGIVYMWTRNIVQQTHSELSSNPVIGYFPQANLDKPFNNLEFKTLVQINSSNMRDHDYSEHKSPGVKRIVATGDSFVFGWGVNNYETVTELLEERYLRNMEVLNLGVSGYCASQQLEWLKTQGTKFEPDLVLFFTYGLPYLRKDRYFLEQGILYRGTPQQLENKRILYYFQKNIYTYVLIGQAFARAKEKIKKIITQTPTEPKIFRPGEIMTVLESLKQLSSEFHFKPVLIYIPRKSELIYGFQSREGLSMMKSYSDKENWGFLDLTPALKEFWAQENKFPYFKLDDHWNVEGHRAAAKEIGKFLKAGHFLEPNDFK